MCDLFIFVTETDFANNFDDNTPHATNKHLETLLKDPEQGSDNFFKSFKDNLLKANPEKLHILVSTNGKIHWNVGKHYKNLEKLVTEIYKVKMNLTPKILKEVFEIVEFPYAIRDKLQLKSIKKTTLLDMTLKQHLLLSVESGTVYPVTLNSVNILSFTS